MKIFGKKNLLVHLWFNSDLSDKSSDDLEIALTCRISEILPDTYHAFGNILVYCVSDGEFEIFDDNLFRNIKEL